ncbi:leucyl/phenylalanyl-tRNA--protein transferase [Lacibacter luteus]|uniref:Leucyl/phenylalanyl-tRNA--protein transferase n=1 Tax=Lacibacter luteus TaxID=2508719 RepID=A0A4Q1CMQ2_9BACT|nr:leucyl/phenylalanyl-tRNA--protein transferase [Lacibacter luteus]RXK62316.1 leucyl/phenylalanyl-tRNA--protein transferase [Lacibacter luteus]
MNVALLTDELWFPSAEKAKANGLLAIGGDLRTDRLLLAYRSGIFPWFNDDEPPLWWCPDPRCVVFPDELYISKSMQQLLKRNAFEFRFNTAFKEVIHLCGQTRKLIEGTWITNEIEEAYCKLHNLGYAFSGEAWLNNELVGGLYGLRIGNVFFGESMFSKVSNASKYAFIKLVQQLQQDGVVLIDCQIYTPHLESLGARMIDRKEFLKITAANT